MFDQQDEDAIRRLRTDPELTRAYDNFGRTVQDLMTDILRESYEQGRTIPETVQEISEVVNTEAFKLERIARTEVINATNEGRVEGYKKREQDLKERKLLDEEFRYTLVVAGGSRTCEAHNELKRELARHPKGMLLEDLKDLQRKVGNTHGFTLSGNSLLHPNQRSVIIRVP